MLDFGFLGAAASDARVTTLQQQLNVLLGQIGQPSIPTSGAIGPSTCAAIGSVVDQMGSVRWVNQVSPTMTTKVVQDPAVFAAAVNSCLQWPPKATAPPRGFPHTYDVQSGDTLTKIATQFGKSFWQVLRTTNPFLGSLGESAPVPANTLWLPMNWPSPGFVAPSTISLPIEKQLGGVTQPPLLPFTLPPFPAGVSPAVSLQAIAALQQAATACPSLAAPNSSLHHAAMAFATFAAVSVALGGDGAEALATLQEQLNAMCPDWRTTVPGPPQLPDVGAIQSPVIPLLNQLVLLLGAAASTGNLNQLPALAEQAQQASLPKTAEQITRLVENPPVAKDAAQESGAGSGSTTSETKSSYGAAAYVAAVVIGGTILYFALK
jgi:LysM domain